jgi:DNA replication protein DnaC
MSEFKKAVVDISDVSRIVNDAARKSAMSDQSGKLKASGAPLRHIDRNLKSSEKFNAALKVVKELLPLGCIVSILGNRGTGKTQLCVEAMRHGLSLGFTVKFCTLTEFLMDMRGTFKRDSSTTEREVMMEYRNPGILVIDEVGRNGESDWERRMFFELLNRRYNSKKDTLVTSNQTRKAFEEEFGPSLLDRMNECGGIIELDGPSFRGNIKSVGK